MTHHTIVQSEPLITRSTPGAFSSPRRNQAAAFAQGHGKDHRRETANPAPRCFISNQSSATRRGGDDEHNGWLLTGFRAAELVAHGGERIRDGGVWRR
jgi:carotenoid cleavage dioxygenase-like enzyme